MNVSKHIIGEKIARQYLVMPLSLLGNTLTMAISDPLNVFILDDLRNLTGKEIDIVIASESQILRAIDQFYVSAIEAMAEATQHLEGADFEIVQKTSSEDEDVQVAEQAPVIRIVNLVIKEAIASEGVRYSHGTFRAGDACEVPYRRDIAGHIDYS